MTLALPRPAAVRPAAPPFTHADLTRARVAVFSTFAFAGMLFAAWVPRIPEMKDRLDLSAGTLGVALLAPALGSLVAMNVVGALSARIGTASATRVFTLVFCALAWLPGLAQTFPMLWVLMFTWGLGIGGLDVAMNAQAVSVEKAYRRPLMSGFHAAWSLGSLIGAGVGTLGAAIHVSIAGQQLGFAVVIGGLSLLVGRYFLADPTDPALDPIDPALDPIDADSTPARTRGGARRLRRGPVRVLDARLALLGVAGMGAMLSEGSVADWSGILLRDSLHSETAHVGLGFAAFMATQTLGRVFGDRIVARFGRVRSLSAMGAIGTVGLAAGLATGTVAGAIAGFAMLGIGLSIMVPVAISAAADGRSHAGPAIAAVASLSYTGFLAGPTGIGFVAQATSVPAAMWLIPVITALAALFSVMAIRRSP